MYTTGIAPIQLEELSHMGPRDWFSEGSGLIHTTCILKPLVIAYKIERPHSAPLRSQISKSFRPLVQPLVQPRGIQCDTACLDLIASTRIGPWYNLWYNAEESSVSRVSAGSRVSQGGGGGGDVR